MAWLGWAGKAGLGQIVRGAAWQGRRGRLTATKEGRPDGVPLHSGLQCQAGAKSASACLCIASSAHWFRLMPRSWAARAALACVAGSTRNMTLPE